MPCIVVIQQILNVSLALWLDRAVRLVWFMAWLATALFVSLSLSTFFIAGNWVGRALNFGPGAMHLALWLLILHRLKGFTASLRSGRPFVEENGRRLRTIGLAVVGMWAVTVLTGAAVHAYARGHFVLEEQGSIALGFDVNPLMLFVGLMLLVIAEVFRIGTRLQEEQDATI